MPNTNGKPIVSTVFQYHSPFQNGGWYEYEGVLDGKCQKLLDDVLFEDPYICNGQFTEAEEALASFMIPRCGECFWKQSVFHDRTEVEENLFYCMRIISGIDGCYDELPLIETRFSITCLDYEQNDSRFLYEVKIGYCAARGMGLHLVMLLTILLWISEHRDICDKKAVHMVQLRKEIEEEEQRGDA